MSINKAILVGNLGQEPEVKTTGGGSTVCTLSVATNERVKRGDNWEDHTEWHRVVCFGQLAENCGKHLAKGRQVYVEGKIRTEKWQDKDGVDRYTTKILADSVQFLGSRPEGGDGDRGRGRDRDDDRRGRDRDDDRRGGDDRGGNDRRGGYGNGGGSNRRDDRW